ncbi:chromate transporter [Trinickia dabaoshanensis]|uniref:Chromate transporter n=1 Tax=Trinickia dabaoshanensis TaxID=564714 RepID=A0A2N7VNU1_9BURK|nr:chromate transporter [Trinickia dabaoshanensis]PMS18838.1 chromate transporter [Trinickia dabaoshanensis]
MTSSDPAEGASDGPARPLSGIAPAKLFRTFGEMSLYGFGGVMPWARRMLVDRRRWLDDREFAELLAIGQILPGPNICNMAVIVGYRACGWRGALAAAGGLLAAPFVIVLVLGALYHRFGALPAVQGALHGMMAVAAGLVLMTGIKLAQSQPRTLRALVFGVLSLTAVGIAHLPLGWAMLVLIPSALFVEWRASR